MATDIAEGFNQGAIDSGNSVQVEICTAPWLKPSAISVAVLLRQQFTKMP
jgi:hypothetical protein